MTEYVRYLPHLVLIGQVQVETVYLLGSTFFLFICFLNNKLAFNIFSLNGNFNLLCRFNELLLIEETLHKVNFHPLFFSFVVEFLWWKKPELNPEVLFLPCEDNQSRYKIHYPNQPQAV